MATKDKLPTLEGVVEAFRLVDNLMPYVTDADSGKVAQVNSSGEWVANNFQFYDGGVSNG